jgi:hypothetical protein
MKIPSQSQFKNSKQRTRQKNRLLQRFPTGLLAAALVCEKLRYAHAFHNGHKEFDNWGLARETGG